MTLLDALDRRMPRFAFARRVGPVRIARRLLSVVERKVAGVREVPVPADLRLRLPDALPRLPFHHGARGAARLGKGWRFTFIGRSLDLPQQIDWAGPAETRADQLWRMNLHYFEYLPGLDRADGLELIRQWIAANPPTRPGALSDGWNSYALSIRIVQWIDWLAQHGRDLEPATLTTIYQSLARQCLWLEHHLELDLGGNHLMRNIAALAWAGAAFDGHSASRWSVLCRQLLTRELDAQLLADGVHYERSPSYHCQVAGDLLTIAAAWSVADRSTIARHLARMLAAAGALSHPDGQSAQFNDAGLSMAPSPSTLETAAAQLGMDAPTPRQSAIFILAGFAAWHHGDDSFVIKGGALGADDLPAHAHGDAGSFELSVGGARLIVDQGVFEYVAGDRRSLSRSAAGHNLTQAGDAEQAHFFGDFRMGWRTRPQFSARIDDAGRLMAEIAHDGFDPTGGCGMLRRSVDAGPGGITVVDVLDRPTRDVVVSRFLLHPDWDVATQDNVARLTRKGMTVTLTASAPVIAVPAAWWPDMGVEQPTQRLLVNWPDGTTRQTFTFNWISDPQA